MRNTAAIALALAASCAAPVAAQAGSLSFDSVVSNNVAGLTFDATVADDLTPGALSFDIEVTGLLADIVAIYLEFSPASLGLSTSDFVAVDTAARPSGPVDDAPILRKIEFNTSNVQAGNIGKTFDVGIAIGKTGIGKNKGDFQTVSFDLFTTTLALTDLTEIGIRTTSVDDGTGDRDDSGKTLLTWEPPDDPGTFPPPPATIPTPAALPAGLAGLALIARRSR